jgi:hypothetical protein
MQDLTVVGSRSLLGAWEPTKVENEFELIVYRTHLVERELAHMLAQRSRIHGADQLAHTRVGTSPRTISGWKLAGGIGVDVGQTTTVERARRSSA